MRAATDFIDDLANTQRIDVRRQGLGHVIRRTELGRDYIGSQAPQVVRTGSPAHCLIQHWATLAAGDDDGHAHAQGSRLCA